MDQAHGGTANAALGRIIATMVKNQPDLQQAMDALRQGGGPQEAWTARTKPEIALAKIGRRRARGSPPCG